MTSIKRFANAESPISLESFEELGADNVLVLQNHRGEDVFIGVQEALEHACGHGMKDPFTGGSTDYSPANAEVLRRDPRVGEELANFALGKALLADDAREQGDLPTAHKLLGEALALAPTLPAALTLQSALATPPSPVRAPSPQPAAAPPPPAPRTLMQQLFGLGRRSAAPAASGPAPASLPRRARSSGIDHADLQALRTLAQALRDDATEGFTASGLAMGEHVQQMRDLSPARLRAIDSRIKIYGSPFAEAFHACLNGQRLNGRHIGPDALGIELHGQLRALGFSEM